MTESQDEKEPKPQGDHALAQSAASQLPFPGPAGQPGGTVAGGEVPPGVQPAQALQLLIHQGIASPQNPEVVKHVTTFLARDSDNRLQYMKSVSERNHKFRMASLCFLGGVVALMFFIPLIALYRGDMTFVNKFMDDYMRYFIVTGLALLAGAKLPDFFK